METVLLALSPFVVSMLTQGVKRIPIVPDGYNKSVLRVVVAVLSYGAVVGTALLNGQEVDVASTETFVATLFNFLSASGIYFISKHR